MHRLRSLRVVLLMTLPACVTPAAPAGEEGTPQQRAEQMAPPEEELPRQPAEGEVLPALPDEQEMLSFDFSEVPTYEWASSPGGVEFLEAAFRFHFANNPGKPNPEFIFLGLNSPDGLVDPPDSLLSRFKDFPNVEAVSRSVPAGRGSVKHRDLAGRSVLFVIENLRLIDDTTIDVVLKYRGGCTSWDPYRFEKQDGKWVMVRHGGWSRMS